MQDFLGNELNIGDIVAVVPKNYRGLIEAKIIKFTAKQIRLIYKNTWNFGADGFDEEYLVYPSDVIKIKES